MVRCEVEDLLLLDSGNLLFKNTDYGRKPDISFDLQGKRIIESYNDMGWTALGLGATDFALGLDYLKELEKMADFPFLCANLYYKADDKNVFLPYTILTTDDGLRVAITAIIGEETGLTDKMLRKMDIYMENDEISLKKVLTEIEGESDFIILLSNTGLKRAEELANTFDEIELMIVGYRAEMNLFSPKKVNNSLITQMYPRGKHIVRLDVVIDYPYRPYGLFVKGSEVKEANREYQELTMRLTQLEVLLVDIRAKKEEGIDVSETEVVVLDELEDIKNRLSDLRTKGDKKEEEHLNIISPTLIALGTDIPDDPESVKIAEKYKNELIRIKEGGEIEEVGGVEEVVEVEEVVIEEIDDELYYVGAKKCSACHGTHYEYWSTTDHATAYDTLIEDKRQFEIGCISCHTTGFDEPGGFTDVLEAKDFLGVQCESCHGPGSLHIAMGKEPKKLHNEKDCLSCHTGDHDDDFNYKRDFVKIECTNSLSRE